ncbi:hypothetical protein BG011_009003 [Mortierella polycephala]|uniref:F-box domain-containing protein n=1 Tax=Mortierella polycephala TaxID=41804 RepID=A0A9P6TWX6_9FUNG|nr:hypothetical protein BG011_009003 [Mortierella polycephala]
MSDSTPVLLPETLQHILSFLRFNQIPTLLSLLRVSKTLYQLTVPILYQNPFILVRNHKGWSEEEKTQRLVILLQLFLSELDPALRELLPPCIAEDYDEDEDEDEDNDINQGALTEARLIKNREYFYYYRIQDHSFLATDAIPRLFGTFTRSQSLSVLAKLDEVFLKHCGVRAQSICLATTRMQVFNNAIPLLPNLRRLEIHHIHDLSESALNEVVEWVKTHNKMHGTLRELQLGGSTDFGEYDVCHQQELVQIPQAFQSLCVLSTRSWSKAWAMIDQIPLESLDRLAMDYGDADEHRHDFNFLLRCRSLKVLDIFVPASDTFECVAELFMPQYEFDSDVLSVSPPLSLSPLMLNPKTAAVASSAMLPPVERLYISGDHINLRNALEDAAVGLSQSLRILKATSVTRYEVLAPSLTWARPLPIQMPFLCELQLQGDIGLEFHFSLLRCCPNLVSFKLMVNGMKSCTQEDNSIDEILSLHKLQTLQLLGRWELSMDFIRGIASNLTALKILDLARCFGVGLDETMEAVQGMKFLWRVGWDMDEVEDDDEVLARWQERAPGIRIGFINWDEYFV